MDFGEALGMSQQAIDGPRGTAVPRVLVIDDDPAVARMIAHVLRGSHDVVTELDPCSALARLSVGERFDLILCDITMPEMSGIQVYEAVSELGAEVASRVAFMTGGGLTDDEERYLAMSGVPQVEKPFRPVELRAHVRELLDKIKNG